MLLRQNNLKITPQRQIILKLLLDEHSHPTANQVYQRVIAIMPNISRTTVYNTLREMVTLGILKEMQDLNVDGLRYDTNIKPHHHLFCIHCHQVTDIEHNFDSVTLTPEEAAGYQVLQHQITFSGICPTCQQVIEEDRTA